MAYQQKIGLNVQVNKKGGRETLEFVQFNAVYQDTYIQYITEYYNPLTGTYDDSKTMIYFEGNDSLLIDQPYDTTSGELT